MQGAKKNTSDEKRGTLNHKGLRKRPSMKKDAPPKHKVMSRNEIA
jgi:hypothetical protein